MHVAVLAHSRHPIATPFAGGLESLTWYLVKGLVQRGVLVSLFASPGSDPGLGVEELAIDDWPLSSAARDDAAMPPEAFLREHFAYLDVMNRLARRDDIDVIHNNSLHYLPLALAGAGPLPLLTTLHTPPTPWMEPAIRLADRSRMRFVSVSRATADSWDDIVRSDVVYNGIDLESWLPGKGGNDLVWFGRLVPEKGAHLAIEIARRADRRLVLAGPVADPQYFDASIAPFLGESVRYAGHLSQEELCRLVGGSALALVTPVWDEPYGLVAAESMACGTPVLALGRGGLPEVVRDDCGVIVWDTDDDAVAVTAAVRSLPAALAKSRSACRQHAEQFCSLDVMIDKYLALYAQMSARS